MTWLLSKHSRPLCTRRFLADRYDTDVECSAVKNEELARQIKAKGYTAEVRTVDKS